MIRRLCLWVASVLGCVCFATAFVQRAAGQAAPSGDSPAPTVTLPLAAQNATDETAYSSAINQYLAAELTDLTGTDFALQTVAREKLRTALVRGSTSAYYTAFAKSWTTNCTAIMGKHPSVGARINIAIITSILADNGQTLDAQPMVLAVLKDPEPCVILWGIKASKPLISVLLQAPPGALTASPIPAAVVTAVKNCGKSDISGFAVIDAYGALAVKSIPGLNGPQITAMCPPLVKYVLDVIDFRISQHAAGLVQAPGAERDIATWLYGVYPVANTADQKRLVQLLVNLESNVGQRADLYQNNKKELAQVREMLKYVTSALKVIVNSIQPGALATGLDWLTSIPPAAPPADIYQHTMKVFATVNAVLKDLTAPPTIPVIEAPTAATKPATVAAP